MTVNRTPEAVILRLEKNPAMKSTEETETSTNFSTSFHGSFCLTGMRPLFYGYPFQGKCFSFFSIMTTLLCTLNSIKNVDLFIYLIFMSIFFA